MRPKQVTTKLKTLGFLARQNEQAESLYLNLGGAGSEIHRADFGGAVLLNPSRQLAFGGCPQEVHAFRRKVMEQDNMRERREGVPGPAARTRVEVKFVDSEPEQGRSRVACDDRNCGRIWIDGYADKLICHEDGYDWDDIENFLKKLHDFCSQGK
jgi:hypothetical protein